MLAFWALPMIGAQLLETHGNPQHHRGRRGADRDRDQSRRQHGRQGGALRRRRQRDARLQLDEHDDRIGELVARLVHAARRRRSCSRTSCSASTARAASGRGSTACLILALVAVFIAGLDGRANARVPGQEDPRARRQARHALRARGADRDAGARRASPRSSRPPSASSATPGRTGCRRSSTRTRRRPTATARRSPASP